jgi:hypothetical protein
MGWKSAEGNVSLSECGALGPSSSLDERQTARNWLSAPKWCRRTVLAQVVQTHGACSSGATARCLLKWCNCTVLAQVVQLHGACSSGADTRYLLKWCNCTVLAQVVQTHGACSSGADARCLLKWCRRMVLAQVVQPEGTAPASPVKCHSTVGSEKREVVSLTHRPRHTPPQTFFISVSGTHSVRG